MTDLDIPALRAKAEAAAKTGEWFVDEAAGLFIRPANMDAPTICDITEQGDSEELGLYGTEFDIAHFVAAAQPRVVLALLDRVEKAEADLAQAHASVCAYVDRIDERDAEITRLRPLLARAGEALAPFDAALGEDEPVAAETKVTTSWGPVTDYSLTVGALRTARNAAREIEEAIGHE